MGGDSTSGSSSAPEFVRGRQESRAARLKFSGCIIPAARQSPVRATAMPPAVQGDRA